MELADISTYEEFKSELDGSMQQAAEAFVKIGYLLRKARDTEILHASGYSNVNDFARAEYGISPDQVSRYIAINERFSEGGCGSRLKEGMQGYGIAKLQIMLTLSDEVVEIIPPEITKKELQNIQKEIKEEEKISDVEVMLEAPAPVEETMLCSFVKAFFHENTEQYLEFYKAILNDKSKEEMLAILTPSGVGVLRVRVPGTGLLMMSLLGKDKNVELINVRTNERQEIPFAKLVMQFKTLFYEVGFSPKYRWIEVYNEEWPKEQQEEQNTPKAEQNTAKAEQNTPKEEQNSEKIGTNTPEADQPPRKEEIAPVQPEIERKENKVEKKQEPKEQKAQECENTESSIIDEVQHQSGNEESSNGKGDGAGESETSYNITSEERNRFMSIAEDIKKALFMQDYKEAHFKAKKLSELLEMAEDSGDE